MNVLSSRRRSQVLSPLTPVSRSSASPVTRPPTPELTVLPSPLACVGFSHTIEQATAERVRQLVVWPEQARNSWRRKRSSGSASPPSSRASTGKDRSREDGMERPFLSYTRTEDGASVVTETRILRWMFGRKPNRSTARGEWSDAEEAGFASAVEETEFQLGGQLAVGYVTDTTDLDASTDEEEGVDCAEDTPMSQSGTMGAVDTEDSGRMADRAREDPHTPPPEAQMRTEHLCLPTSPLDPLAPESAGTLPIAWTRAKARRSTVSLKACDAETRPSIDRRFHRGVRPNAEDDTEDEGDGRGRWVDKRRPRVGRKRCLQLDLRGIGDEDEPLDANGGEGDAALKRRGSEVYHMDKSGLVTLFSDLLDKGSIRMLYSSTFNTANILVEAGDVHRARRLLQGRAGSPIKVDRGR